MFKKIGQLSFISLVMFGWLFSGWPQLPSVDAAIGDIGHWRDTTGGQIPGTTFSAFDFNSEIQNDGSFITDGNGQMIVLELPDYVEVFRSHDSTGLQDLTGSQTLNIARDVDFGDALSFTKASNTAVDVTNPADIFSWANVWTARNNIGAGSRQTSFGSVTINGVEQSIGEHGNYSRGNQSTTDTFAMSFHPAGIFTVGTAGYDIGINSDPLAGGQAGGNDRTQPNTLGFFAINLDTLVPPQFEQSAYRWFANSDSTDVGAALDTQDTPATLSTSGETFRLRMLMHVSDNQLRQNETNFKLQFAEKVGSCDTSFTGETYTDVTTSTVIAFNDNATPADGDSLTANPNDPINGVHTIVNQSYEEVNNFTTSVSAIADGQDGKWDFSLIDNGAPVNTSYCFRMVESNDAVLDTYTVIPEITTASSFCPSSVNVFPYNQDFEGSIGDWVQSTDDDIDWDINSGTTTSVDTGPSAAATGTDYIYVEASTPNYPNIRSIITSPCFDLSNKDTASFDFQYHMYSVTTGDMGSIDLEITTNGSTWTSLFNETVNQGDQWNSESIDLTPYVGQEIQLRFNRFIGDTWQADVAVDDVSVSTTDAIGPGGGVPGMRTWLKANVLSSITTSTDGSDVTLWEDQSIGSHDYSPSTTAPDYVDNSTNNINFNQTVNFNSSNNESLQTANSLDYNTGTSVRKVVNMNFRTSSDITNRQQLFEEGGSTRGLGIWILGGEIYASIWNRAETAPLGDWNNGTFISTINTPITIDTEYVLTCEFDGDNSGVTQNGTFTCYLNGESIGSLTGLGQIYNHTDAIGLGFTNGGSLFEDGTSSGGNYFNGDIAEFIYQNDPASITTLQRNKTESYLALKYGVTLDQSLVGGGIDYLDSTGVNFWSEDINDVYEHDIVGVGRDDTSVFDQRISQSVNTDAIITIALDNDFTSANNDGSRTTTHTNDRQFLVLANNDDVTTIQTTEIDLGSYSGRIGREWLIQKTANFTQNVNLKFDGFDDTYELLIDADGDFSSGATNLGVLSAAGEITNINLIDGQYITLAQSQAQEISFSISDNTIGHGLLSLLNNRYASGDEIGSDTFTTAHTIDASTNASGGYVVEIDGITLTNTTTGHTINPIGGTAITSTPGTEQFGIRLIPTGTGDSVAPYDTANFAYDTANFSDIVASGVGDNTVTNYNVEYIANIDPLTPAGTYTATVTYTMHAEFN